MRLPGQGKIAKTETESMPAVLRPGHELGGRGPVGAAEDPAADAPDPAPAAAAADGSKLQPAAPSDAPGAAAAGGTPGGAASADKASDGTLGLQRQTAEADEQPDAKKSLGSPGDGRSDAAGEAAAEEAATDDAAAAPKAEPAADPPPADGGEEGGTAGASGSEQAVPPMHATVEEADLDSPVRQPTAPMQDADASSGSPGDALEQPPAPPADMVVRKACSTDCCCRF
jgi:hypothetical protein